MRPLLEGGSAGGGAVHHTARCTCTARRAGTGDRGRRVRASAPSTVSGSGLPLQRVAGLAGVGERPAADGLVPGPAGPQPVGRRWVRVRTAVVDRGRRPGLLAT